MRVVNLKLELPDSQTASSHPNSKPKCSVMDNGENDGRTIHIMKRESRCFLVAVYVLLVSVDTINGFLPSLPVPKPSSSTSCRLSGGPEQTPTIFSNTNNDTVVASPLMVQERRKRAIKGVASRTGSLNEEVARLVNVTLDDANELVRIGAVWARMETLSEQDLLSQYDDDFSGTVTATNILYGDIGAPYGHQDDDSLEDYVERMQSQRYRRILTPSMVEAGTDLRVYPQPRRFPSCYDITSDSILYEDTTFLVVDKPPMLPTQPDASNYYECCPGCVHDLLGPFTSISGAPVVRPLLCHRVDSCVGGCVVLAKDRNGQRVFQEMQRDRKLRKLYLAVTTKPVPLGIHLHWMWAPQNVRGRVGGPPCQLVSHTPPESRRKAKVRSKRCLERCVVGWKIIHSSHIHTHTHCALIVRSNFGRDAL